MNYSRLNLLHFMSYSHIMHEMPWFHHILLPFYLVLMCNCCCVIECKTLPNNYHKLSKGNNNVVCNSSWYLKMICIKLHIGCASGAICCLHLTAFSCILLNNSCINWITHELFSFPVATACIFAALLASNTFLKIVKNSLINSM